MIRRLILFLALTAVAFAAAHASLYGAVGGAIAFLFEPGGLPRRRIALLVLIGFGALCLILVRRLERNRRTLPLARAFGLNAEGEAVANRAVAAALAFHAIFAAALVAAFLIVSPRAISYGVAAEMTYFIAENLVGVALFDFFGLYELDWSRINARGIFGWIGVAVLRFALSATIVKYLYDAVLRSRVDAAA